MGDSARRSVLLVAVATATALALVGCVGAPTTPQPDPTAVASALAAELEALPGVRSVAVLPEDEEQIFAGPSVEVGLDPGIDDAAITQMGELVSDAGDSSTQVRADFTAGDFTWQLWVGSDNDLVSPVLWLRSDPRVLGAEVDSLTALGFTADTDVLATIADFHAAMRALEPAVRTRLEIRQPDTADGAHPAGLDVAVDPSKAFPSISVAGVAALRLQFPAASVFLSLLEGDYQLDSRVSLPAGVDTAAALAAVTATIVPSVGADATRLTVGVVSGAVTAYTDAHLAFVAAMAGVPDLTGTALGEGSVKMEVGSIAGWTASQDVAAGLGEPFEVSWHVGDRWLVSDPIPASDPMRSLAPAMIALPSVFRVSASPGKIIVALGHDVAPADLQAMVAALVASGVATAIEFSLEANDDQGSFPVVVRIENGNLTQPEDGYDDLIAPFLAAWHSQVG